LTTILRLKIC